MRILVAVDDSDCSQAAVDVVTRTTWPEASAVKVVSVARLACADSPVFGLFAPEFIGELVQAGEEDSRCAADRARCAIERSKNASPVECEVLHGDPVEAIVQEAGRWHADLIVVGSHDRGPLGRFTHGSISQSLEERAPCSVRVAHLGEAI